MSSVNYKQYGLAPFLDLELGATAEAHVFEVTLDVRDGKVFLDYRDVVSGKDYIAIKSDSTVTIVLKGDQLFLADAYEAITTKEELSSYYGSLSYGGYVEKYGRYKSVQFKARFNEGGKYGTLHPFNINVDLLQYDDNGDPRWITLSIDPDITNPPPRDDNDS